MQIRLELSNNVVDVLGKLTQAVSSAVTVQGRPVGGPQAPNTTYFLELKYN